MTSNQYNAILIGGTDMKELYVTLARKGLDESALTRYPFTGGVFRLQPTLLPEEQANNERTQH